MTAAGAAPVVAAISGLSGLSGLSLKGIPGQGHSPETAFTGACSAKVPYSRDFGVNLNEKLYVAGRGAANGCDASRRLTPGGKSGSKIRFRKTLFKCVAAQRDSPKRRGRKRRASTLLRGEAESLRSRLQNAQARPELQSFARNDIRSGRRSAITGWKAWSSLAGLSRASVAGRG
jgi:hypothetical protein